MRESYGLRIECAPVARVWSGVGDLVIPADIVEASPALYLGGGELLSAPDFQQLINGTAERLNITVSGVTAESQRLALEDAPTVKGARVHLVRFDFDDDWQLVGVEYEAVFRADTITTSNDQSADGRTRTITLSIGTENTDRSRAPCAFWTDADQRRRSPTDRFFDHVAGITSGTSRRFGPND
ncbi:MAG: hypothetical protein P0Y64_16855 [Candidatus Sphingomonas colombiensis]|nr:hypothetical protein [Sphingomonas sp.]WEK42990.1 MAG: hypothetical protein P0Y64_16855 [Sphingomonas sp.]